MYTLAGLFVVSFSWTDVRAPSPARSGSKTTRPTGPLLLRPGKMAINPDRRQNPVSAKPYVARLHSHGRRCPMGLVDVPLLALWSRLPCYQAGKQSGRP